MQGPIDVLRSLYADPSFAATFSMVAWFILLLVCGLGYCVGRCILGLREENSNEGENEPQRRRSTLLRRRSLCRNCARCNMWFRPIDYVLEVKQGTSKISPKRYASEICYSVSNKNQIINIKYVLSCTHALSIIYKKNELHWSDFFYNNDLLSAWTSKHFISTMIISFKLGSSPQHQK